MAGPLIFFVLLLLIFQAIFSWAVPFMDAIEAAVAWTGEQVRAVMPDGFLEDLIVDGAITGVGNVLVFLPQILLLFFFLGIMEDTGYMARTAFIMDRLMRRLGLSGASVVPLLSGYACAVPAIMAARTLDNERDRIITIMVTPLMSCSARLPVYTLFISAFIPNIPILGRSMPRGWPCSASTCWARPWPSRRPGCSRRSSSKARAPTSSWSCRPTGRLSSSRSFTG